MNTAIRVPQVRCVDADGQQLGILDTREAMALAERRGLDLVEVAPTARPPVCRIVDYGRYKYELGKKEKAAKRHQTASKIKEIKFHANVAEHDYQTKVRHALEFLDHGHRVKFSLYFRGRENVHQELGYNLLNRVIRDCGERAAVEQPPRLMGRSLIMMMTARHPQHAGEPREPEPQPAADAGS